MHIYRTHHCSDLRPAHIGNRVRLSGWVHRIRDHGGVLFIDLRDETGITQCVARPGTSCFDPAGELRLEMVVRIDGDVFARPPETENTVLPTGKIEVVMVSVDVLGPCAELPFPIAAEQDYPEEIRLKYRFLDLRRTALHRRIKLRSNVIKRMRQFMEAQGFTEIQTPILTASSPEGARDYLVPSRVHPGKFYALPQAPQQFKQLLMVAGFDRYFQIAPCFRDEDARADRSPGEFYQLDMEMAFATQNDVFNVVTPLLHTLFSEFGDKEVVLRDKHYDLTLIQFPRITYDDAMLLYGTDKPDLRNPIRIADVSELFARDDVTFNAFKPTIAKGGVVRAIPAPRAAMQPRGWFDKLNQWARDEGAVGLGYIQFDEQAVAKGPIAKHLPQPVLDELITRAGLKPGDAVFFSCDQPLKAAKLAGAARTRIGRDLNVIPDDRYEFCWIVDFPMYEWNEDEKKIDFSHNPFSLPQGDIETFANFDPERDREAILALKAYQYDIVCNGVELSSGAIRNHRPDIMKKAFELAGYDEATLLARFGGMYRAFQYGAPPHGGIAPGVDRIVMLLAGEENLREIVAFPMNQRAEDLMMGAPAEVDPKQLRELSLNLRGQPIKKVEPKDAA